MKRSLNITACLLALLLCAACGSGGKDERSIRDAVHNVGSANFQVLEGQQTPASVEDIIPPREALVTALKEKGYDVKEYGIEIKSQPATWVYAEKYEGEIRRLVDITYCETDEQAQEKFKQYFALYYADPPRFYVLARNEYWVYCFSDKLAFRDAGFTSLANNGEQYILE
ncbi:MAG: hypothetical protein LBG83_01550 [Oscillospiraceae bacterium]|jgi:uncharacterized lipoprotein|nr:hypothetical protein [Oscillospiraceae bacterium]